jgi:hypothetical protein
MISSISKEKYLINRIFPILENFPFSEFNIEMAESPSIRNLLDLDEPADLYDKNHQLIKFVYTESDSSKLSIVIFEQELNWIINVSSNITNLDKISKTLNRAIKSKNLLVKRNAAQVAEAWCSQLKDNRTALSYSTMGEILLKLTDSQAECISIINKLGILSTKTGIVSLNKSEYQIILTYYHFQLIYAKLLLGLVISTKISI